MAEQHIDQLERVRAQLVERRRGLAEALAKPDQPAQAEAWIGQLISHQTAIEAIDRAIADERKMTGPREGQI